MSDPKNQPIGNGKAPDADYLGEWGTKPDGKYMADWEESPQEPPLPKGPPIKSNVPAPE